MNGTLFKILTDRYVSPTQNKRPQISAVMGSPIPIMCNEL